MRVQQSIQDQVQGVDHLQDTDNGYFDIISHVLVNK